MNILAICCALNNSYFAIEYNNQIYSKIIKSDENYHSLYLISEIKKMLNDLSIKLQDINLLAVNCGPGSFTGIRVALSIAKVISGELNIPIVGLNSAEILLNAFNKDILIMDARRDMYFVATKENIELKLKNDVIEKYKDFDVLCDKNSSKYFEKSICFEEIEKDLGAIILKLAKDKYQKTTDKSCFNYQLIEPNYIQTPPVF